MVDDGSGGTPTLIEVNTRWHLTDFAPLTDACVGYNAVEETLSAYLDPGRFASLPRLPPAGPDYPHGGVVHLVSHVEGPLQRIHHEEVRCCQQSFNLLASQPYAQQNQRLLFFCTYRVIAAPQVYLLIVKLYTRSRGPIDVCPASNYFVFSS